MLRNDRSNHAFAGLWVRHTDNRDFANVRMLLEVVLHLLRRDVFAVPYDDVLRASRHDQVVPVHPASEITGAVISFVVEDVRFLVGVEIADEHLGTARPYFTF